MKLFPGPPPPPLKYVLSLAAKTATGAGYWTGPVIVMHGSLVDKHWTQKDSEVVAEGGGGTSRKRVC